MATQFSIDDAFVLEGDEEEGAVSDGETEGWKARDKDREGGEMTFGPLTFSKPQNHPSPAATGSLEHSNLKYQVRIHPLRVQIHCCLPETATLSPSACSRIWKMKTLWAAMAIPLSITSSKSGGANRQDY